MTYTAPSAKTLRDKRGTITDKIATELSLIDAALDGVEAGEVAAGSISETELANGAVTANKIGAAAVTKSKLYGGFLKVALLAGAAAGDHTVTGIVVGDELVSVLHISTAASVETIADLTSEFTVAAGKITNALGTDTTNDQLLVIYLDLT